MSNPQADYIRQRRAESIWRRHLRSYLPAPAGKATVVRITSTGYLLALVPPKRGPRSGEACQ